MKRPKNRKPEWTAEPESPAALQSLAEKKELTPTAGEPFPDGIIELVKDPSDSGKLLLLHRTAEHTTISSEVAHGDRRYVPINADPGLVRQLQLPTKDLPSGSSVELVDGVLSILMETSDLTIEYAFLLTLFVIASFFSDCLQMPLCVWLVGLANTEAMALLRVLGWFCRHPLLLVDDTGIDHLPENLTATRLFYAPRPSAKLRKLVSNLQAPGFGFFRAGLLRQNRGATVIYSGSADMGSALNDTCLVIPVAPGSRLLRSCDEDFHRTAVEELQARLLNYRLAHFSEVRDSQFDVEEFAGPTREIARALGACLVDAPDLRNRLIALLRAQNESVQMERSAEMWAVLESLMVFCHERRTSVHVGEIATTATEILSARGEWVRLSPKEVGSRLKLLGFPTTRLDAGGRGVKLTRELCARIHEVARTFGAPATDPGLPGCPDCNPVPDE